MQNLTWAQAQHLADLLGLVTSKAKIKWSDDGGDTIREGMIRQIIRTESDSIFEDLVWITTTTGWEIKKPVQEMMDLIGSHLLFEVRSDR